MTKLPTLLSDTVQGIRPKRYPRGQIIFYQNDYPLDVAILSEGFIKVYDIDEQGNEKVLHILRKGAIFPFSFFSGEHREPIRWFYSALTDCEVYVLNREAMRQKSLDNAELTIYLMNWFSLEVHELLVRLSSLGKSNARGKIIAALNFLAVHCSVKRPGSWKRVSFPVNHQLLADMTGVTRESAATIMKDLTKKGCVRNPRQTILELNTTKLSS